MKRKNSVKDAVQQIHLFHLQNIGKILIIEAFHDCSIENKCKQILIDVECRWKYYLQTPE
jgi:hypothetical protein